MSTGVFSSNGWYNIGLIPGLSINEILTTIRPNIDSHPSQIRIYVANVGTATHLPGAQSSSFTHGLDVSRGDIPESVTDVSDRLFFPSQIGTPQQFSNFFKNNLRAPTGYFNRRLSFNGRSIDLSENFAQPQGAETFAGADWVEIPSRFWNTEIPTFNSSYPELSGNSVTINSKTTLPIAIGAWIFIDNINSVIDISANLGRVIVSNVLLGNAIFRAHRVNNFPGSSTINSNLVSITSITTDSLGSFDRSELINLFNDESDIIVLTLDNVVPPNIVGSGATNARAPSNLPINIIIPGLEYASRLNITNLQNTDLNMLIKYFLTF